MSNVGRQPDDFEAELRAERWGYWDRHRYHVSMALGDLDERDIRMWVANRWYYQRLLPQKDAAIISRCPLPDVRRIWVQRIIYHDGTADSPGGMEQWLNLAEAVGLARADVLAESFVTDGTRRAVDSYVEFARTHSWLDGVASSLTELFAPEAMAVRVSTWRRVYPWLREIDLGYFENRIEHAPREASSALEIVRTHCLTRQQQRGAIAALRFKNGVLNAMLDALEQSSTTRLLHVAR